MPNPTTSIDIVIDSHLTGTKTFATDVFQVDEMQYASPADLLRFREAMGFHDQLLAPINKTFTEDGPFKIQPNRIRSYIKNPSGPPKIVERVATWIKESNKDILSIHKEVQSIKSDTLNNATALKFQYRLGEIQNVTTIVARGVNTGVNSTKEVVKNQ